MRARIQKNIGVPAVAAIALTVVALYSLWGATLLEAQRHAEADSQNQVALNR